MEINIMFLDWKNQCCQNDYTIQGNIQIQSSAFQIIMCFSKEVEGKKKKILKMRMETEKTLNSQSNLDEEKQN